MSVMTADIHALAGAYALDALPHEERLFFERHLAECEVCAAEVSEFAATAATLGAAAAETPPLGMRARVLAAADSTRQIGPLQPARPQGFLNSLRLAVVPVAAAVAVAVIGIGVSLAQMDRRVEALRDQVAQAQAAEDTLLAVLTAADQTEVVLEMAGGDGAARFLYSASLDRGVLVGHGMPALPAGKTFELWLFHDGHPVPAGVFDPESDGRVSALTAESVRGAEAVAVTIEPHGGVPAPTGPVVASGGLQA